MPRDHLGRRILTEDARRLRTHIPQFVPLTTPLTSASWDGDSFSTTAKTVIDLSAVFGVPAGARAVLVNVVARDSGSTLNTTYLYLAPNNTADLGAVSLYLTHQVDNGLVGDTGIVPCDANGDIYYQIGASGAGTMDVWIRIWGYWL